MRKISQLAAEAFHSEQTFKSDNTTVVIDPVIGGTEIELRLFGNLIAKRFLNGSLEITTAGWPTATTKERLNALNGVSINTSKGKLYLNGKEWDGSWVNVGEWSN